MTDASIGAGRIPYLIDFRDPGYEADDCPARHPEYSTPNAWSSHMEGRPGWHLPAFDVDHDWGAADVQRTFPEATDVTVWLESSTPGHHHCYINRPYEWTDYLNRLEVLVDAGVVEDGYLAGATHRGATFLRMPHVRKDPPPPPPVPEPVYGDDEPF